jgi:hypothetical protein
MFPLGRITLSQADLPADKKEEKENLRTHY